ncbi:HAD-like domain-containing protein [Entophlyctis helioformis]|nr:HAD-like domain-containing protein [Entophlyctis helioformis]
MNDVVANVNADTADTADKGVESEAAANGDGPVLHLTASWNGTKYHLETFMNATVGQLKRKLEQVTQVQTSRQKLIGLAKGKLPSDNTPLSSLNVKEGQTFMMMGTVEEQILKDPSDLDLPAIEDDFDYSRSSVHPADDPANQKSLRKVIDKTEIHIINELRPGKRMLVLDLDWTLFDPKGTASSVSQLARPGLHEFLAAVYPYYDLCIWSQTAWKWLEAKITSLGMLMHSEYKIAFVLDQTSMFSITSMARRSKNGAPSRHQVKPLQLIWTRFGQYYGPHNTVHVDDLSRNFAMNPQSGLKITPFKASPATLASDRELMALGRYLLQIVSEPDFAKLNHKARLRAM